MTSDSELAAIQSELDRRWRDIERFESRVAGLLEGAVLAGPETLRTDLLVLLACAAVVHGELVVRRGQREREGAA